MRRPERRRKFLRVAGIALLALLCVGGTELLVCRFAAPELYQKITGPVRALGRTALDRGRSLVQAAQAAVQTEQTEPVSQAVSEPEALQAPPAEDPKVTEFAVRGEREILTGGVVELVYYNQGEAPWADGAYGPDNIRGYGCGPTALAMLISSIGGESLDPIQAARAACEAGYCAPGSGSYLSIVEGMAADYGLKAVSVPDLTAEQLCQQLATGHLFVALMGKGHFTNGGHFIVLRGVTLGGKVLVADPNSRARSLAGWEPELILDELSRSRANGAPLWRFSLLEQGE